MAIDYVLQLPCEVRKNMPEAKLLALVKHWEIAEFAIAKIKKTYPHYDMDAITKVTVEMGVIGPDGTTKQMPVTVGQILAMIAPLDGVKSNCTECPANVAARSFGCIGKINYPITSEAETWLLSRLPEDAKSPSLSLLFKFIAGLEKIDGAPVDSNRRRAMMFALKTPVVRKWGGWFDKKQISSSQIIHMLTFGGTIAPDRAQLYTDLLGLNSILSEPHPPSDNIEQFKTLACAIIMAGRLNVTLLVEA